MDTPTWAPSGIEVVRLRAVVTDNAAAPVYVCCAVCRSQYNPYMIIIPLLAIAQ